MDTSNEFLEFQEKNKEKIKKMEELELLKRALAPLGEFKINGDQIKINCPRCEKELENKKDKFNLEINLNKKKCHCWACGLSGLSYVIEKYGFSEFSKLFENNNKFKEKEIDLKKILSLPEHLSTIFNYPEVLSYLNKRGITSEIIKERKIKYCYEGFHKGCIIFPSYNEDGKLTAFLTQNYYSKEYRKYLSSDFICFGETFINKNSLIIITEGQYDGLVVPNSLILLGTEISDKILDFLTETDVLVILDADVNDNLLKEKEKQLKSVCNSVNVLKLTEQQHDLNYFFTKNPESLKRKLLPFYQI